MSCLERDGRLFELHVFTSQTATDLKDIQYSVFKDGARKTLTMARCFEHEKRACDTLRQLILTHNKMEIPPHVTNSSKENGNLSGTNAGLKEILERRKSLQVHYQHRHARLLKRI